MLESNTKLYYSIKEVSELTKLKPYVLRYWESEFSQLKPKKNRAGNRTYKQNDIDLIIHIKTLLYDKKYTIKGKCYKNIGPMHQLVVWCTMYQIANRF